MLDATDRGWPTDRGTRGGVALQFGETRADLLGRALTTGDPLADDVAEAISVDRGLRAQLDVGLRDGLAAIDAPDGAIAALLSSTEALPPFADAAMLDGGLRPFFSMPPAAHIVSLSAGALIRVYESPSIANVLTTTGRLVDGADRRIRETGTWVNSAMMPDSLRPGGPGYIGTVQVRMLHAQMRRLARTRGFDEAALGAPINQVDLGRTWMDFTLTSLEAEERMGFGLTSAETAEVYRYWWLIAHLLGIAPELVDGVASNAQARRVDDLFQSVTGPLIPESAALASATLASITGVLHDAIGVPASLGGAGLHALARLFHGRSVADELGIRDSAVATRAVEVAIGRVRSRRAALRSDLGAWEAEIDATIERSAALLSDRPETLYAEPGAR